ncbi:MAG: hypothetical protein WBQ50_05375 [Nocardioides sp.]
MSDPWKILRDQEGTVDRLPADEVRRRGDRRRNRRTALQALGATAAVLAVVGGVALTSGGLTTSAPEPLPASQAPAPSPTTTGPADPTVSRGATPATLVTEIPDDFPLALGYPEDDGSDTSLEGPGADVEAFGEVTACGRGLDRAVPTDRLAVGFSQPEDFRSRELTVYGSDATAQDTLARLAQLYRECPREESESDPASAALSQVSPASLGEETVVVARTYEYDGTPAIGLELIVATRVGNAVLLSSVANEGGSTQRDVDQQTREQIGILDPLVDQLCEFSTGGCRALGTSPRTGGLLAQADVEQVTDFTTDWSIPASFTSGECWEGIPETVLRAGPASAVYQGRSGEDVVNARVLSASVAYPSAADAADAFAASRQDIDGCGPAGEPIASQSGATTYWRMVSKPAPEVCTECGTAWLHATGIALVDDMVVAINVSWIADLEMVVGDDDPAPVSALLTLAADVANQER